LISSADSAISKLKFENRFQAFDAIVVYDGTPAQLLETNFCYVLDSSLPNVYYFGEKPIVTDPIALDKIVRSSGATPFFCDFIETSDPAVIMMKEFVRENKLLISKMRFWRASASGIKHLVGHDQQGVQGGALLDKAPHDLSIAVMFLGAENIRNPTGDPPLLTEPK
jgi:hypothetical protein